MNYRLRSYEDARLRAHEAWAIDVCMKKHFSDPEFDGFKYNFFLSNCSELAMAKKRECYIYASIAKKYPMKDDCVSYFLANSLAGRSYVRDYTEDAYLAMLGRWDVMVRNYRLDCQKLRDRGTLTKVLSHVEGSVPVAVAALLEGEVTPETVSILDHLTHFCARADPHVSDRLLWPDVALKIQKYGRFLNNLDFQGFKNITLDIFNSKN